jgi:hypothetical protein
VASLGTKAYGALARAAARGIGSLGFVRGVYARRSLACGEIIFGRSDIDLTVLIDRPAGLEAEVAHLLALSRRFAAVSTALPLFGPPEVATAAELADWYRSPDFPATPERDRGWLRLYGEPFAPPNAHGSPPALRRQNLPWLFWAWTSLPDFHRAGRVRTCCNLLLDMIDVLQLSAGRVHGPSRRAAVLARWSADLAPGPEIDDLARVLRGGRPRAPSDLLRWVYRQSLEVADALDDHAGERLEGVVPATEVVTRVPFSYRPRRYLLVDPRCTGALGDALDRMERDPEVFVTTARALRLYLVHRNPWEYFTIADPEVRAALQPPREDVLRRAVRYYLHRIVPRRLGLAIGTGADRSRTIGPQIAQARLWVEHGVVARGHADLVALWRDRYGDWPWRPANSCGEYFTREYPLVCRAMDAVAARLGATTAEPTPFGHR